MTLNCKQIKEKYLDLIKSPQELKDLYSKYLEDHNKEILLKKLAISRELIDWVIAKNFARFDELHVDMPRKEHYRVICSGELYGINSFSWERISVLPDNSLILFDQTTNMPTHISMAGDKIETRRIFLPGINDKVVSCAKLPDGDVIVGLSGGKIAKISYDDYFNSNIVKGVWGNGVSSIKYIRYVGDSILSLSEDNTINIWKEKEDGSYFIESSGKMEISAESESKLSGKKKIQYLPNGGLAILNEDKNFFLFRDRGDGVWVEKNTPLSGQEVDSFDCSATGKLSVAIEKKDNVMLHIYNITTDGISNEYDSAVASKWEIEDILCLNDGRILISSDSENIGDNIKFWEKNNENKLVHTQNLDYTCFIKFACTLDNGIIVGIIETDEYLALYFFDGDPVEDNV